MSSLTASLLSKLAMSVIDEEECMVDLPEEDTDSMTTMVGGTVQGDSDKLITLLLMMHELLSCIGLAPVQSVHSRYDALLAQLHKLNHLIVSSAITPTSEEVVDVLLLHQSITGLIGACPHTFIVKRLEDYVSETKTICEELGRQYKHLILGSSSVIVNKISVDVQQLCTA